MKTILFHKKSMPKTAKISKEEIEKTKMAALLVNTISGCSIVIKRLNKLKNHVHQSYKNVR